MEIKLAMREQEREVLAWIIRKFPEGRVPAADAQYLIEHPEELPDMLLAMMARRTITTPAQLQAVVSDWQKLFNACKQDWFNKDFTEARWPLESVSVDEAEWEEYEHFFDDDATGEVKIRRLEEMVKRGEIRICGVRRAMEDTADHLDIQLDHPRIIPVSALDSGGVLSLPAFHGRWFDGRERELFLYRVSNDFNRRCGWLVLRKRP